MRPARQGQKWQPAEDDQLLTELRSGDRLEDIAAQHQRSPGAICARIERVLVPESVFTSDAAMLDWARSVVRSPQFVRSEIRRPTRTTKDVEELFRTPGILSARRRAVLELHALITAETGKAAEAPSGGELDVLAGFDDDHLAQAGRAVLRRRGGLDPADWVLECDCAGIAELWITAEQIRTGDEEAGRSGARLVRAGLARLWQRNREILLMRLGLTGNTTTMEGIAQQFGLSRERIRQIQKREVDRALISTGAGVRRGWHEARDRLCATLAPDRGALDPALVLAFVELAMPRAPREVAVTLVGRLCGGKAASCRDLLAAVETCHREREQRTLLMAQDEQLKARASEQRSRRTAKVLQLIGTAEWPPSTFDPAGGAPTPVRSPVQRPRRSKPCVWWAPRLGREVICESKAELHVIQLLDAADDLVLTYCEQPTRLSYVLYGVRHDYYPDLLVDLRDGRRLLVEVKGGIDDFALAENVAKFTAARDYCQQLGWGFTAITERMACPADLASREVDTRAEQALRDHLAGGPIDRSRLEPLLDRLELNLTDVAALALRNGWFLHRSPFRLSDTPLAGGAGWGTAP
ncbi:TnsA endonuclease N-terminal domain-containing protein [Amycolatopsis sp. lyj-346]|uniref:TnsA endonuclease N-terminal domain-containing protein n=1 Tax=Amycolatopsis sp. lyj-346 TaxID=2789289 RepID=UPI00397E621F